MHGQQNQGEHSHFRLLALIHLGEDVNREEVQTQQRLSRNPVADRMLKIQLIGRNSLRQP
jgi:hypothetical protein